MVSCSETEIKSKATLKHVLKETESCSSLSCPPDQVVFHTEEAVNNLLLLEKHEYVCVHLNCDVVIFQGTMPINTSMFPDPTFISIEQSMLSFFQKCFQMFICIH